jgi:hypothetical protein
METIDSIIDVLPNIRRKFLTGNRKFFNKFCDYYHKENPIDVHKDMRGVLQEGCGDCDPLEEYIQDDIDRCWKKIDVVKIQWCEVIDLLWERPELVNPAIIDEYVRQKVAEVCKEKNKKNPLAKGGMWDHFGKHWKDTNGQWQKERRKRF